MAFDQQRGADKTLFLVSQTPIDIVLDRVDWKRVENDSKPISDDDMLPKVTHEGVMDFLGTTLRVYRLDDGRAIINAEDLDNFLCSTFANK